VQPMDTGFKREGPSLPLKARIRRSPGRREEESARRSEEKRPSNKSAHRT
jgi:hypothetical protein